MAFSTFAGSFNVSTDAATTTKAITGVGFTPKVVIFTWNGRVESTDGTTDPGTGVGSQRGFGVAVSSSSRWAIANTSVDASASAAAFSANNDAACIVSLSALGAVDGAMDVVSMDADGFTLVIDDAFPTDLRVSYLALGGTTLANVNAGKFTATGAAPTTQAVTGVGFQPECVIFASTNISSNPPTTDTDSNFMLGVMTSSASAVLAAASNNSSNNMVTASYCRSGEAIAMLSASVGGVTNRASLSSFDSDGFTVSWAERGTAARIFYLALDGLGAVVGDLMTVTDTTTDIVESGFGFQPQALLFASAGKTAASTADTLDAHDVTSIGFAVSASSRSAQGVSDENAATDSDVFLASEYDEAVVIIDPTSSVVDGTMDIKSIDADGFTGIMDNATANALFVWYLALGVTPAGTSATSGLLLMGLG